MDNPFELYSQKELDETLLPAILSFSVFIEMIEQLLDAGVDVTIKNDEGKTARDYIRANESLVYSDVYMRLKELNFSEALNTVPMNAVFAS